MSEYSPRLTLKPANSIVASLGIGMHALSSSMRTNTPGRPSASMTLTAKLTSGSVSEARTVTGGGRVPWRAPCRGAWAVRLFDPQTPRAPLRDELAAALGRVLDDGRYILGPEVEAFEREFAAWLGTEHVVGVANGTEAITIALRALGVGPGDEVVVPSFTFYASAEAIPPPGATPGFCDVDPATFVATADAVRAVLTPRTKAVILVHLFGNVAPVAEVEALGAPVLEDAAQATGSRLRGAAAGALGTIATFSLSPSKK